MLCQDGIFSEDGKGRYMILAILSELDAGAVDSSACTDKAINRQGWESLLRQETMIGLNSGRF